MVTVLGPAPRDPPTPPVALSQVLNLNSEEAMYLTSEDEVEHREREGSPHFQRSGDRDPHAMDVDDESSVGRDRHLTLTEVEAWSFGKLEGLIRPSFSRGLNKPSLSEVASRVSIEPQPAFVKFPFSRQAELALLSQNGALQGLDKSLPEEEISYGDRPLKAIDANETVFKNGLSLRRPAIRGLHVAKYYQPHDAPCRLDVVPRVDSEMKALCGKDVKPILMLQHLENVQRTALAQVAVASQNEVFGASLAAHLSSLSEGLPQAQEEFSAALADLANAHPQDVSENQVYEVYSKGTALVPIELDHVCRELTTMSDGEAPASYLAAQTLASMVFAHRAAYLDCSGLQPWIQHALMALPIESSKLFTGKVQEARLWDAEEDKVDQRKVCP